MKTGHRAIFGLLAAAGLALGQVAPAPGSNAPAANAPSQDGGWRRIGSGSDTAPALQSDPAPAFQQNEPSPALGGQLPPATLTVPSGTFLIVRLNDLLSSDRNHVGDHFTGTLVQPLVVDGYVVAQRGELVVGTVADAQKGAKGQNVSRLQIGLTSLTLVNGNQLPIRTELVASTGPGWTGQDTGAVVGTTGFGAAIGAIAGGGPGAAIGAVAGGAASLAGVLMTHGHPTVIPPESVLTFRTSAALAVSTTSSPQSFMQGPAPQYSQTQQPALVRRPSYPAAGYAAPGYGAPGYPAAGYPAAGYYGYPAPYPYWGPYYYPGYYPGVYFGVGVGRFRRW